MPTTKRDYYEVLNVSRTASEDEIRKAHRKLVLQYHPDRNTDHGASEMFKEIQEAYEVLSDRERRAAYDRFGHAAVNGGMGSAYGRAGGFGIEDLFDTFFGGAGAPGQRQRVQRGADLRYDLKLTFEEAVFGVERELTFPRNETCSACNGKKVEPGSQPVPCVRCAGTGELRRVHQNFFGQFVNVSVCDNCDGAGSIIRDPCKACRGQGMVRTNRTLQVSIPAGIDDNSQIRLSNEGEPGPNGGPRGHLYLVIHVEAHRFFRRSGNDLLLELPINFAQAALGDELEIPTLDGDSNLKIPAGTQSGRTIRIRGKGVPHLNSSGRGDLQVKLRVVTPTDLSDEQKKLLKQLAATFDRGVKPQENKGFFDKVKDVIGM
jgi:molecular chaperone DnaJ